MLIGRRLTLKEIEIASHFIPPQGLSLFEIGQHFVKMQKTFSPIRESTA